MTNDFRIARAGFWALAVLALRGSAPAMSAPPTVAPVAPGLAALLASRPRWSASGSIEGAYGFKDNLLLSSLAAERSAFARGAVEALVLRTPTGPVDYSLFAQAQGTTYFSGSTVDDESTAWVQTELGYRADGGWKFSLPLTGFYYDQVFDVSDTEVERLVAELKLSGIRVGPTVRWSFHPKSWVEVEGLAERKRYEDRVNDGRVREASLRVGWVPGGRFEARLTGSRRQRDFDSRAQHSAAGRVLFGTRLEVAETEGELRVNIKWDREARWQTTTRAGVLHYRDNGSGYFNFREQKIDHELEWSNELWLVRLGGVARRVDFGVQTVGLGINPPPRLKDEYSVELRVERTLSPRWSVVGGYTWERSRSNDPVASYRVNEGLLGVRWNWER